MTEEEQIEALKTGIETLTSIIASLQDGIDGNVPDSVAIPDDDFMDEGSDEENVGDVHEEADGDDDEDEDDDHKSLDEDGMLEDIAIVTEGDRAASEDPTHSTSSESAISHLVGTAIPLLLPLCTPKHPTPDLVAIQIRAMNCLNNISWTSTTSLPPSSPLFQSFQKQALNMWSSIVVPILRSNTANVELAEAIAGFSWAIAKSVGGNLPLGNESEGGIPGEHKSFISLYNAATTDDLRSRCVGVLGSLGLAQGRVEVNKASPSIPFLAI